jgi:hypothetical protein
MNIDGPGYTKYNSPFRTVPGAILQRDLWLLYRDGGGLTGIGDKTLSFDIALIVNQGVSPFVAKTGSSPPIPIFAFYCRFANY